MRTVTLLNRTYTVHDNLNGFNVNVANDKVINFFGTDPATGNMFFQFKNGNTYIYKEIPQHVRSGLWKASSIIKYYASNIRDKYRARKLQEAGVTSNKVSLV